MIKRRDIQMIKGLLTILCTYGAFRMILVPTIIRMAKLWKKASAEEKVAVEMALFGVFIMTVVVVKGLVIKNIL